MRSYSLADSAMQVRPCGLLGISVPVEAVCNLRDFVMPRVKIMCSYGNEDCPR